MCFAKLTKNEKPLIATEDIICYKICTDYLRANNCKSNIFISPIMGKRYKLEKRYKLLFWQLYHYKMEVNRGFHSYNYNPNCINSYYKIVKCIIPKGSKYYHNRREYVSNAIIIKNYEISKTINNEI